MSQYFSIDFKIDSMSAYVFDEWCRQSVFPILELDDIIIIVIITIDTILLTMTVRFDIKIDWCNNLRLI